MDTSNGLNDRVDVRGRVEDDRLVATGLKIHPQRASAEVGYKDVHSRLRIVKGPDGLPPISVDAESRSSNL
jgi:hypothetical protein